MKFENIYFINGTAYAGKSTLVKRLAEKYNGIACEENYHDALLPELDRQVFPYFNLHKRFAELARFCKKNTG